jgi:hypothetical protein
VAIIPIQGTFNAGNSGGFCGLFGIAAEVFINRKHTKVATRPPASGNLAALFSAAIAQQLQPDKPPLSCGNFQES